MALINNQQLQKHSNIDVKNFPDPETLQCVRDIEPILCFAPPTHTVIHRPMVNLAEFLSSYSMNLNSYEERIGVKVKGEKLCSDRLASLKEVIRTSSKRQRHDSGGEKKSPDYKRIKCELNDGKHLLVDNHSSSKLSSMHNINADIDDIKSEINLNKMNTIFDMDGVAQIPSDPNEIKNDFSVACTITPTVIPISSFDDCAIKEDLIKTPLSNGHNNIELKTEPIECVSSVVTDVTLKPEKVHKKKEPKLHPTKKKKDHFRPLLNDETIREIKKGWNLLDVGDLTIGDLYIMFGQDFKVDLEYSWVAVPAPKMETSELKIECTPPEIKSEINVCQNTTQQPAPSINCNIIQNNSLGNKLKQLLILANMAERSRKGFKAKVRITFNFFLLTYDKNYHF